jgi:hypothetical protein
MRTTIDLPDDLYKNVRTVAIEDDTTLRQMVLDGLALVLEKRAGRAPAKRLKLPLIRSSRPGTLDIDSEKIYEIIDFP